jgi:hypothetical protein
MSDDRAVHLSIRLRTPRGLTTCSGDVGAAHDSQANRFVSLRGARCAGMQRRTRDFSRGLARRCAWPNCGGYWLSRPNRTTLRCADGRWARECYVTEIEASALGLSEEQTVELSSEFGAGSAIIQGSLGTASNGTFSYAVVRAEAAWVSTQQESESGVFYRLDDNGIRCTRAPCFSIAERKLNSTIHRALSDLDTQAVELTDVQQQELATAIADGHGAIAVGHNVRNRRTGAVRLVATRVFLPLLPSATTCETNDDCVLTQYPTPVSSEADCYCPGCPSPALAGTAGANQASWQRFCLATHDVDVCPARPCAYPPPAACNAGVCGFGAPEL